MASFYRLLKKVIISFCLVLCFSGNIQAEFSKTKLKELVEPIALYPDQLLFQMLPAATFPDQLVDAGLLIKGKSDAELIAKQSWDQSVKEIANYPGVLKKMNEDLNWTKDLGDAFLYQDEDLLKTIQQLRSKAKDLGNLESGEEQVVKTEKTPVGDNIIVIEPTNPEVIYLPSNTTTVVYSEPNYRYDYLAPLVTFGAGVAVGLAINHHDSHYYYGHGHGYGHWYDHHHHEKWANRRWDHIEDKREFRQDRIKEQQDFRNDTIRDRQDFRQDEAKNIQKKQGNFSKASTINQDQWQKSRNDLQDRRKASGRSVAADRGWSSASAKSRAQSYKSSPNYDSKNSYKSSYSKGSRSIGANSGASKSYGRSVPSARSYSGSSSAFNVSGTRRQVASAKSRGSFSRGSGGRSRSGGGSRRR